MRIDIQKWFEFKITGPVTLCKVLLCIPVTGTFLILFFLFYEVRGRFFYKWKTDHEECFDNIVNGTVWLVINCTIMFLICKNYK